MSTIGRIARHKLSHGGNGQSLAEYALLLALVAVGVIVVAFLVGTGIQRVYGIIGGTLGSRYNTSGTHTLTITSAQCISVAAAGQTGLWITGLTDEALADLTGSTEFGLSSVGANGGGFVYNPTVAAVADTSRCPHAVVIQARDGSIAFAPITAVSQ